MKRDPDLVRQLLIFFDAKSSPDLVKIPSIEGYDVLTIKYHGVLLYDAGFLRCEPVTSSTSTRVIEVWPFELTWAGHEFLDTAPITLGGGALSPSRKRRAARSPSR